MTMPTQPLPQEIYLDYAAATPVAPEVLEAMLPYFSENFYNPSAAYNPARAVRAAIDEARAYLAQWIGAKPGNLIFCAGATEANNLACTVCEGDMLIGATEHDSLRAAAAAHRTQTIPVGNDGRIDLQAAGDLLTPSVSLISVELANGEIGVVQPIRELARLVKAERMRRLQAGESLPLALHTDATQAALTQAIQIASLGVDLLTLSAAKLYGPKQMGVLWYADHCRLKPLIHGGGQESSLRSGTENVPAIMGFARAALLVEERRRTDSVQFAQCIEAFLSELRRFESEVVVHGPTSPKLRLPGIVNISIPGIQARRVLIELERRGVYVATGSACAASRMTTSSVLKALNLPQEEIDASLRISVGRSTTIPQMIRVAQMLAEICAHQRKFSTRASHLSDARSTSSSVKELV